MFATLPKTSAYLKHAFKEMKGFEWEGDFKPMARQAMKDILEGQLKWEIETELGFKPYERDTDKPGYRNGYYSRHLLTEMGDITLSVPRLREKGFEFEALKKYLRRSKSVDHAVMGCFIYGNSTRKVGMALAPLLGEIVSSSTVSRICQSLDQAVEDYHNRPLEDKYQFLYFDGVFLKKKGSAQNRQRVFLCVYGITHDGKTEMIDFYQAHGESQNAWESFLRRLYDRGLRGEDTELIVTDGGKGLHAALEIVYSQVPLQRCWAHKVRNLLDKVKPEDQKTVKKWLQRIWNAANKTKATQSYWHFSKEFRQKYPKMVQCLDKDLDDLISFYEIKNKELWKIARTTNPIERAFREIRRRSRPMGVFTNKQSMERIVFAVFYSLNNPKLLLPF